MKKLFLPTILFWCLTSYAQVKFESGYYIDNSGNKHDVLIQNSDPKDSPTAIKFKNNINSEVINSDINQVQEYQVGNAYYVRAEVNIDRTLDDIRSLTNNPNPQYTKETLFLKVLLDGKADLFLYTSGTLRRYFYRIDQNDIEQLVYHSYLKQPNSVAVNKRFQQQLFTVLNCDGINSNRFKVLDYKTSDLVEIFKDYNTCKNEEYETYLGPKLKGGLNLKLKAGAGLSNIDIEKNMTHKTFQFQNTLEPRVGLELEYIMPFNKNKWSLLAEATYRSSSYEEDFRTAYQGKFVFKYNSLEVFGGLRHYMFLKDNSKIFINGGLLLDSPLSSEANILETTRNMDPEVQDFDLNFSSAFGLGYDFANKFSAEIRYTNRNIYGRGYMEGNYDLIVDAEYSSISLILGYNIF